MRRLVLIALISGACASSSSALELCRDDGCTTVKDRVDAVGGERGTQLRVTANGVTTSAWSVRHDLDPGRVYAYEILIFRAGFENGD